MSRRQKWIFFGLLAFPIVLSLSFRALDNHAVHQRIISQQQERLEGSKEQTIDPNKELEEIGTSLICRKEYSN
ncbi:hypothetical protein [Roseivirga misakiensis]|uniref:Uncharacterized protein n=1 Tax=Roseivirga misakiensis TaxID=1563681 RepID=A0A1E5SLB7_9BACT|nr:hypothetical protein [Roseivirga misakiensis]OEJ99925.1 hypothetical protein BFP71_10285 [Roseivirga misakiensis]